MSYMLFLFEYFIILDDSLINLRNEQMRFFSSCTPLLRFSARQTNSYICYFTYIEIRMMKWATYEDFEVFITLLQRCMLFDIFKISNGWDIARTNKNFLSMSLCLLDYAISLSNKMSHQRWSPLLLSNKFKSSEDMSLSLSK